MKVLLKTGVGIVIAWTLLRTDHVGMTCREEILVVAGQLKERRSDGTFSVAEVLELMHARGTTYLDTTIKSYVVTKMCSSAPKSSATHYPDLERVAANTYRLASALSHAGLP